MTENDPLPAASMPLFQATVVTRSRQSDAIGAALESVFAASRRIPPDLSAIIAKLDLI